MRKLIVLGVLAALAAAVLATPAFDHHFAVIAKAQSGRFVGDKFRFKDKLVDPENRSDKVGRDWGWCKARPNTRRLKCRGLIHLNGKIGGFGDIRVRGDIGRDDKRLSVVGGTKDFNGVAGKLLLHNQGRTQAEVSLRPHALVAPSRKAPTGITRTRFALLPRDQHKPVAAPQPEDGLEPGWRWVSAASWSRSS